jgi:hypothetical protein
MTSSPADAPCQCHRNHAYVAPTHDGHCCFQPATQNCHQAEVAAWEREHQRHHPGWEPEPAGGFAGFGWD